MTQPAPQRIVTISIDGTGENADVYYTYSSPVSGLSYLDCPVCDMTADQAINTLFVLDYFSAKKGWTITGTSPKEGSLSLQAVPGALNLSILTINPYTSVDITYKFYIHYLNTTNGAEMERDPQVGNVVRPT